MNVVWNGSIAVLAACVLAGCGGTSAGDIEKKLPGAVANNGDGQLSDVQCVKKSDTEFTCDAYFTPETVGGASKSLGIDPGGIGSNQLDPNAPSGQVTVNVTVDQDNSDKVRYEITK